MPRKNPFLPSLFPEDGTEPNGVDDAGVFGILFVSEILVFIDICLVGDLPRGEEFGISRLFRVDSGWDDIACF